MQSKVFILNNQIQDDFKAVVNFKQNEKCAIKFFNLKEKYKNLALGIRQHEKVVKIPLALEGNNCKFELKSDFDFTDNFTCAVVDVSNAFSPQILLTASQNTATENKNIVAIFEEKEQNENKIEAENFVPQNSNVDLIENALSQDENEYATQNFLPQKQNLELDPNCLSKNQNLSALTTDEESNYLPNDANSFQRSNNHPANSTINSSVNNFKNLPQQNLHEENHLNRNQNSANLYEVDSQEQIENIIDKNLNDDLSSTYFDACANCKYREVFYSEGKQISQTCSNFVSKKINDKNENLKKNYENMQKIAKNEVNLQENETILKNIEKKENKNSTTLEPLPSDENFKMNPQKTIFTPIPEQPTILSKQGEKDKQNNISSNEHILQNSQTSEGDTLPSFYEQISSQIDALFSKYDKDETLNNLIPNSKWAKVTYDSDGNFYVLGLVNGDGEKPKYVCYGMPSSDPSTPPDDLLEFAEWVEVGENNGYWIVCQDATNGETIKIKLV